MNETEFQRILRADAALNTAVGGRFYPTIRKQGSALPAVVYTIVSSSPENYMDGPFSKIRYRIQCDVYSSVSYAETRSIMDMIVAAIEAEKHVFLGENFATFEEDTRLYRVSADFSLWIDR